MNFHAIPNFLAAILILLTGIFAVLKNRESKVNFLFFLLTSGAFIWQLGTGLAISAKIPFSALIATRIAFFGIALIPVFSYHLSLYISGRHTNKVLNAGYTLALLFFTPLSWTPLILNGVYTYTWGFFFKAGRLHPVFMVFFIYYMLLVFLNLFLSFIRETKPLEKNRKKYLLIALFIAYIGSIDYLPTYGIKVYPFGYLTLICFVSIFAYAILRFRIMDINLALTRAGIFAIVYTLVLGVPLGLTGWAKYWLQGLFGQSWYWAPVILAIILATAGPFIYLYLQRRAEKLLRKEQLAYQEKLRLISSTMMLIKELDRLLKTIVLRVVDIVQVSWAGIYLKDKKESKYILKHQRTKIGEINLPKEFSFDSDLVKHFYKSKLPIIGEEIHSLELKVGLAVPCFIEDNLLGFLLLGDKPKGQIYDQSDVNTFTFLANQTALAIENCQFYTLERQSEHVRKIASLDLQSASMAHEIDNPNQALLRCLESVEMLMEELEGVIPQETMEKLKYKISRGKFNSTRISKMIEAVREYSQVSTGELKTIRFDDLIESFHEVVKPQLKYNGIDFKQELPHETIWLRANKIELEQVLVNLVTNSVQAIMEIWQSGQNTPESKREIVLKAYKIDSNILRIDLSDTGSGIKKELLEDIFLYFVTTKASTVGTGMGLAIARNILNRHKGKIWVDSEGENKGATFHIELPIPNDITEEEIKQAEEEMQNKKRRYIF